MFSRVKILFCIIVFIFLTNTGFASIQESSEKKSPSPDDTEVVKTWISQHAIPLNTVEAGNGFKDLAPLKKILKNVRIVALGEATHGTREFFQFKHRMLEFLVEEMGFRIFAIEASYAACNNINDYVLTGKGNPAEALASQKFWTWDTHEVRDMIAWMREYNKKSPEDKRVKFLGYDLQHLGDGMKLVESYIRKLAPDYTDIVKAAIDPVRIDPNKIAELPNSEQKEKDKILAGLHEMMGILAFHQTQFTRKTSKEEFRYVLQHARVLTQFYDAYSKPMMGAAGASSAAGLRDLYMAENIEHILQTEGPDARIVVWAHNGHISKNSWGGGISSMGAHLQKLLGDKYYALGFAFNEGSFQSRMMDRESDNFGALIEFTVGPAPEGSAGWYLAKPGLELYVLDLRSSPEEGKIKDWLNAPHPFRFIGSGFSEINKDRYLAPTVLMDHFDGIVYFGKTTRARPNPTGERGPFKK